MAWDNDIELMKKQFTARLIVQRALARGWRVQDFVTNRAVLLLYVPGRIKPVKIFSASPMQMPFTAAKIARDKYITNRILSEAGIPVPDEILVNLDEVNEQEVSAFIERHGGRVVVKPLDAGHGKGVTMGVTQDGVKQALESAASFTDLSVVLVQEELAGIDVRVVCIDNKFADSMSRTPASVLGDGKHTIGELVAITNQSEDRGEQYKARLNRIPMNLVEQYLMAEGVNRIPAEGENVQVIGVSNIGMGGVRTNTKDVIPVFLQELACKAADLLDLPVCGIDFMVKQLPTFDSKPEDLDAKIIEANNCPSLTVYDDLNSPDQLALIDRYLDFVAKA